MADLFGVVLGRIAELEVFLVVLGMIVTICDPIEILVQCLLGGVVHGYFRRRRRRDGLSNMLILIAGGLISHCLGCDFNLPRDFAKTIRAWIVFKYKLLYRENNLYLYRYRTM